jgi:hypothetical protein
LPCGIRSLTGIECPGCGMQRALIALLKGDLITSLRLNPALMIYLAMLLFTALHLRFSFRYGGRMIIGLFIAAGSLMIVNFFWRLSLSQ